MTLGRGLGTTLALWGTHLAMDLAAGGGHLVVDAVLWVLLALGATRLFAGAVTRRRAARPSPATATHREGTCCVHGAHN